MKKVMFVFLGFAFLVSGCSKHKCKLKSSAEETLYGKIAEVTKGARFCFVRKSPYGCTPGTKGCRFYLSTTYFKGTNASVKKSYKDYFTKKGYKQTKQKTYKDGSSSIHYAKGTDKIITTYGRLGKKFVTTSVMRSPKGILKLR